MNLYIFLPQNDYSSPEKINEDSQKTISRENNSKIISLGNLKYKIVNFLSRFTYSYNFIRSLAYILDVNFNYGYENLSYFYKDKLNIDYTFRYLEKIINSKKVNSFIIIIPTIYDINNFQKNKINYKNLYWYNELEKLSKRNNSILIDLMDYIKFEKKPQYFHSCDGHWSEIGNLFAADIFLKYYNSN